MKKTAALLSLLLCVSILLSGCAREQVVYQEVSVAQPTAVRQSDILNTVTNAPAPVISFPEAEEEEEALPQQSQYTYQAPQQVEQSRYAGSTPIPLDPVDLPTPTPRPDVTFEYETYEAAIGYSFEAPSGWEVTRDDSTAFILTDPEIRDGVNAQFIITVSRVDSGYRVNQLKTELNNQLNDLKRNYVTFNPASATSRALLKYDGFYNTYRGVTYDGTIVRGLVHLCLAERRIVSLSFMASGWYNTSYTRVYNRIKNTIK